METTDREYTPAVLDTLFEDAPFGLAFLDPDFRYVRVNEALAQINHRPAGDHVGRTIGEVLPDIEAEVVAALSAIADGSDPLTLDLTGELSTVPGQVSHAQARFAAVRESGELVGFVAMVLETTGEKTLEEQRARMYELERSARSRAEGAELRAQFILESGTLLDTSLDLRTTLRTLSRIAVPRLAHLCVIDMVGANEKVSRVAIAHADPEQEKLVWELTRRWPSVQETGVGIRHAIRLGATQFVPEVTEEILGAAFPDPDQLVAVRTLDLRSAIIVPLRARDRTLGAITFALTGPGPPFAREDVSLVEDLARRAALSVDNSRLFTELRRADRDQRFLSEASRALAGSLDWSTTLDTLGRLAVSGIADMCVVTELDPLGEVRVSAVQHRDPEKAELAERVIAAHPPRPDSYAGQALASGETLLIPVLDDADWQEMARDEEHLRRLREINLVSALWVPMFGGGRLVGAFGLGITESGRRFGGTDVALAEELARRAGVAADNARLYSERSRVARTLQRSLMPARLPDLPHLEAAVRFRAAGDGAEVGGDFYDVWETSEGHWSAVVGDVCGKGAEAAALTALARHTIRAAARYESGPAGVLRTLNLAIAEQSPELMFCTAALVELRPDAGGCGLRVALGGHLPPLMVRAGGEVAELPARGALLGVFPQLELEERSGRLEPGDAVVLYTDGVTEAGAPAAPFGEEAFAELLSGLAGRSAAEIAGAVEGHVLELEEGAPRDDVAVLVLRCTG